MKSSLLIGKPFGVRVAVHWTFLILIGWVVYVNVRMGSSVTQLTKTLLFVFTIFVCVILHELGHAMAAKRYGIITRSITLLPIGGVANLTGIPEEPKRELFIAIAGPVVNLAIAGIIMAILLIAGFSFNVLSLRYLNNMPFFPALLLVNVGLFVFNLTPAFPMDGGRMLRAGLGFRLGRLKATMIAARTGQLISLIFAFWGIRNDPILVLIAAFVFFAAQAELQDVRSKSRLEGKMTADLLVRNFTPLDIRMTLNQVLDILLKGHEEDFIVLEENKVAGILTKGMIFKGLSEFGSQIETGKIMETEFQSFSSDQSLKEVYEKLQLSHIKIAPVLDNDVLVGIIQTKNIHQFLSVFEILHSKKWA